MQAFLVASVFINVAFASKNIAYVLYSDDKCTQAVSAEIHYDSTSSLNTCASTGSYSCKKSANEGRYESLYCFDSKDEKLNFPGKWILDRRYDGDQCTFDTLRKVRMSPQACTNTFAQTEFPFMKYACSGTKTTTYRCKDSGCNDCTEEVLENSTGCGTFGPLGLNNMCVDNGLYLPEVSDKVEQNVPNVIGSKVVTNPDGKQVLVSSASAVFAAGSALLSAIAALF